MSMMGELKFFLGLHVHQSHHCIFISQSQYAIDLLKKHETDECDSMSTPMAATRLDADLQGIPTNETKYHSMIRGLMYLTANRPDIAFATFKSSSPVQSSPSITTKAPTKPTQCASNYGDFGCLSPNNMTDFKEDEKEFENTRSVAKEDKDEQGKEEKGVVKFFEVGTDEENNSDIVFNDVRKGNDTWADARLKHGSYLLLDRILEDGWYFLN
ncbi:retrovirus-related pol polyprotein from transposon TNT 1-94 [Tanacetum coccineum]